MALTILLRLLLAHFLGDFLFQRNTWITAKARKKEKAPELYYHILTVTLLTYLFLWDWAKWYVPLIVMISHLSIDIWKSYRRNTFVYFLFDQLLHLLVIAIVWIVFYFDVQTVAKAINLHLNSLNFWTLAIAYYVVTEPLGIAIGIATRQWQKDAGMDTASLNKAGIWIGRCERVLVLTFIIINQFTALGFLMAAKSILRFGDKADREQKKTEYILVGTLISFTSAALAGMITRFLIK